ncbi:MAG TPA: HlyD family type I secretion periplasmic adaptor subunit [Methylophilaceae bacterium]|nr:HlyD family type I secretion periplasmic adaptor subunit [Methylophilaceae bacterium]
MSLINAILFPKLEEDETGIATRVVRKGMFIAVVLAGGFFLWASIAPLSGAVIADGTIKITTNRKTVQHLEGGIVKEILVRDGDTVKQGQPLITLEDTKNSAEVNILRDQYDALLAKEARLFAEKTLVAKINFPAALLEPSTAIRKEFITREVAVFNSKRKILNDQISLLRAELNHSKEAANSYQSQLSAIEENIRYKQEQLVMREGLLQKNFVGKTDVLNFRQSLTDKKELLGAQTADYNNTKARIAELDLRIIDVKNRYIQDAESESKEVNQQLSEIAERIRPAEDSLKRRIIAAPIGGQVISLKVTTVGGIVPAGQPIMDIVPVSDDLVIEVKVKNTDVDTVYPGQRAEVQLNAYNQRTTPMVKGEVVYIAGDAVEEPQSGSYYYPAQVKIDKNSLKLIQHVKLEPGMPATAYIKTLDRTMMEYFLSPLTQRMRHTFREE